MIDNLISNKMKAFGLIWRYILKVMNFLIFRDFFLIFKDFLDLKIELSGFYKDTGDVAQLRSSDQSRSTIKGGGDVTARGVYDRTNKSRSLIFT